MIMQAGPVFWLILALGIAAATVFFERLLKLRRAQIDSSDFLKGVCNVLEKKNVEEAMMICEETPGPVAAVVLTAIRHRQGSREAIREAVDNTGRAEISRLERRLASLAITCQIAPLLGLVFLVVVLGSIAMPGTPGFEAAHLALEGLLESHGWGVATLAASGNVLAAEIEPPGDRPTGKFVLASPT